MQKEELVTLKAFKDFRSPISNTQNAQHYIRLSFVYSCCILIVVKSTLNYYENKLYVERSHEKMCTAFARIYSKTLLMAPNIFIVVLSVCIPIHTKINISD
jgi:hypothetical protein